MLKALSIYLRDGSFCLTLRLNHEDVTEVNAIDYAHLRSLSYVIGGDVYYAPPSDN
jgi:hypothetical protein